MNKNLKFGLLTAVILGTLGWLAMGGIQASATYYKEIAELQAMGAEGVDMRLRVGGDIVENSIVRNGNQVRFTIMQQDENQEALMLDVVYDGVDWPTAAWMQTASSTPPRSRPSALPSMKSSRKAP